LTQIKADSAVCGESIVKGWNAMQTQNALPRCPGIESIVDAIADWINNYRRASRARAELRQVGSEEVARIAHDLNVTPGELSGLVGKGPGSAALLDRMLVTLGLDRDSKCLKDPRLTRDLQRLCFACRHKARCAHELDIGTAKEHYREFCPNAYTLGVLTGRMQ
jgi:hypothetical protein